MLTLTDRGLISRVSDTASLTTTEIAGHGGLVAAVSGFLYSPFYFICNYGKLNKERV